MLRGYSSITMPQMSAVLQAAGDVLAFSVTSRLTAAVLSKVYNIRRLMCGAALNVKLRVTARRLRTSTSSKNQLKVIYPDIF